MRSAIARSAWAAAVARFGPLAMLLLQAAGTPARSQSEPADLTVVHARLAKLRLELGADDIGLYACRVTASSGDPLVDGFACRAARICTPLQPRSDPRLLACIDDRIIALVVKHDGHAVQR